MNHKIELLLIFSLSLMLSGCFDSDSTTTTTQNSNSSGNSSNNSGNSGNDSNSSGEDPHHTSAELYPKIIKKTGQTISYNAKGEKVTNGSIKDDGYYQKGKEPKYQRDDNTAIVKDLIDNYEWADTTETKTVEYNYDQAKEYCQSLTLNGKNDWQLPSLKLLLSLVDYTKRAPAMDATFKNSAYGIDDIGYWSTTIYGWGWHWWVNFFSGKTHFYETNSNKHFIRCVRGNSDKWAKANFARDNSGVVTDKNSGLEWQDAYTSSIPVKKWEEAINYCETLTLNGKDDWRLPNINELYSITDHYSGSPAINDTFKNTLKAPYWSSTTYAGSAKTAWIVNFQYGSNSYQNKNSKYAIRCVRGGE